MILNTKLNWSLMEAFNMDLASNVRNMDLASNVRNMDLASNVRNMDLAKNVCNMDLACNVCNMDLASNVCISLPKKVRMGAAISAATTVGSSDHSRGPAPTKQGRTMSSHNPINVPPLP
jgi:hypothetical protein